MPTDTPSITSWSRLEPVTTRPDPDAGLRATLHDPAWLLARQWQTGEFVGSDNGSAARTTATVASDPLDHYRLGSGPATPLPAHGTPLETLVEREPVRAGDEAWLRLAAEAGAHFARLLALHGVGGERDAFAAAYPMPAPAAAEPVADMAADPAAGRLAAVVAGRLADGRALYAALRSSLGAGPDRPGRLPAKPAVPSAQRAKVRAAAVAYLDWYESAVFDEPAAGEPSAWVPERLRHDFGVSAATPSGPVSFSAADGLDERLDWYTFDLDAPLPAPARTTTVEGQPTRVTFRGMPAARFWEVEDDRLDLGAVDAAPEDVVRLLLVEFALVFGQDWSVVPLPLAAGAVHRVVALDVVDTFGRTTRLRHYSEVDGAGGPWQLFAPTVSSADGAGAPLGSVLLLPQVLAGELHGETVEEVLLLRDEMAELAWAVEKVTTGPAGRPVDRAQATDAGAAPATPGATALTLRLSTGVPDSWVPLLPVTDPADQVFHLLRAGRLLDGAAPRPRGRLLEPADGAPLQVREEEVPRDGTRLHRRYRYTRGADGAAYLWVGRGRGVGRGEAATGLAFDVLEPEAAV